MVNKENKTPANGTKKETIKNSDHLSISLIIPAYNEAERIENCLSSAINQTDPIDEIIVVNNKSTDDTVEITEAFIKKHNTKNIKLIHQNEFQALIPTRNLGFDTAKGDILGRIDADCILTRSWAKEVRKLFSSDKTAMGMSGAIFYYDMPIKHIAARLDKFARPNAINFYEDKKFLFGSNMAFRREVWDIIKSEACLDKEDVMHEDIDLSIHMAQNNLPVVFGARCIVGMSARRMNDKFMPFMKYISRFKNTYNAHGIHSIKTYPPRMVFTALYFPVHFLLLPTYTQYFEKNKEHILKNTFGFDFE